MTSGLSADVVRHWVAWGPAAGCPDELIEHDAERIELFEAWLAEVKAQAWEEGALTDWGGFVRDKDIISANPYRQGEEQ